MGRIAAIPFFHPKTGLIKKSKNKKSKGYFCDKVPTYLQNIFTNIDIKLKSKCTANKILDEKELGIPIMIVREDYLQDFKDFILSHPKYLSKFKDLKELMELFRPDSYCMYYLHIPDESQGRPFLESRFCPSNEEVEIFQKIDNYVETIKEGIYPYLEEWVGTVINLAAEYVMFKLKFPAIFFNCEECFRPGLFIKRPNYCIEKESIEGQKLWGTANIVDVLIYTSAEKYGFDNDDKKNNVKLIKTNLIYHDESFFQRKDEIYCDCEFFQRHINGAFIMTVDINSITLAMDEIKKRGEEEQFDLIVTGSTSVKILKLFEKKNFLKYIKNIFIFAYFVDKYTYLKDEYPKVKEICFAKGEIIEYLENLNENKPLYKLTNLITYDDYKYKYHILHKMIAEQYGKYTEDCYNAAISVIQDFLYWSPQLLVQPNDSFDETKIQTLIKTLQNFKDISFNESHLIKIYSQTTGSFYNDFNNWLKELDPFAYKKIAWFIASLMYQLNRYKDKPGENNGITQSKIFYRGIVMNYTDLLLYKRCEDRIICYPSFTSSSELKKIAEFFAKRDVDSPEERKKNKLFSVILTINYKFCKNFISYAIDISKCSDYPDELERIFLPFSFFKLKDIKIDYENNIADIEMDSIGRKEILEETLCKGNNLYYNEYNNIGFMEVK